MGRRGGRVQALICRSAVGLYPRVASLDKTFDARLYPHPGESFWLPLGVANKMLGASLNTTFRPGEGLFNSYHFTLRESKTSSLGWASKWGRPGPSAMSYLVGREDIRTNNRTMLLAALKSNAAAGYQGPVKKELLKGAGLVSKCSLIKKILTDIM